MSTQLLIESRFVAVFPSLVKALKGDLTAAAVLQAIHYRSQVIADANGWLEMSLTELGDEIGISVSQAYRATVKLRKQALLESDGIEGQVRVWRVRYDEIATLGQSATVTKSSRTVTKSKDHHDEIATHTIYIESSNKETNGESSSPNINTLAQEVTKAYTDRVPLSKFVAVMGIVKRALATNLYTPEQITDALIALANEGRPVTVDTLRIALEGMPVRATRAENRMRDLARDVERIEQLQGFGWLPELEQS